MSESSFMFKRLALAVVCAGICAFVAYVSGASGDAEKKDRGAWRERSAIGAVIGFVAYYFVLDGMIFGGD